jgi:hypothetical protein
MLSRVVSRNYLLNALVGAAYVIYETIPGSGNLFGLLIYLWEFFVLYSMSAKNFILCFLFLHLRVAKVL